MKLALLPSKGSQQHAPRLGYYFQGQLGAWTTVDALYGTSSEGNQDNPNPQSPISERSFLGRFLCQFSDCGSLFTFLFSSFSSVNYILAWGKLEDFYFNKTRPVTGLTPALEPCRFPSNKGVATQQKGPATTLKQISLVGKRVPAPTTH